MAVPIQPSPAKYAFIANSLQDRIVTGAYPIGAMLPSESQLVREFAASRSTVVRALEYLRQLGYIEGVQGKGRMVLGVPLPTASQPPARVRWALHAPESSTASLVGAGRAPASPRVAAYLAIPTGEPVIVRQRLMPMIDSEWYALSTAYLPAIAAAGTAFAAPELLREGALDHLERRRNLLAVQATERLTARTASAREATLLTVQQDTSVLASLLIARDAAGHPALALDLVLPVSSHGIEDLFRLR